MGTPLNFLVFCWAINVRLWVAGDAIEYAAPGSIIGNEFLEILKHHKQPFHYLLSGIEDGTITKSDIYAAYELEVSQCKSS